MIEVKHKVTGCVFRIVDRVVSMFEESDSPETDIMIHFIARKLAELSLIGLPAHQDPEPVIADALKKAGFKIGDHLENEASDADRLVAWVN